MGEFSLTIRVAVFLLSFFPVGLCAQVVSTPLELPKALRQFGDQGRDRIFADFGNLYNQNNIKNFGVVLLGAGAMANTKIDGNFQNWYRDHVRSDTLDDFSNFSKVFGEGLIFIPVIATSAVTYRFVQTRRGLPESVLGDFTARTLRGYVVGTPTHLAFQVVLGGERPNGGSSRWQPFHHPVGVSGHAFVGAVPFITAAQMTDRPCVKGLFYALSIFSAWSRVNDDAHYLSQSLLGWYLAYLSVRAVTATESRRLLPRGLTIFPVAGTDSVGIGLHYQF